jgi:hypothetical protein
LIELTEQQGQALKNGETIRLYIPEIGEDVVLISLTSYQNIQESLEDQRGQKGVLNYSMRQARRSQIVHSECEEPN